MQNINMNSESNSLRAYLEKEGTVSHQYEDALVLEAVNADLSRGKQSLFRQRAEILKKQIQDLQKSTHAIDAPVYFYGVGHHGSLIAWDIAFNGRDSYSNVDEIPKPLSLISINPEP